MVRLSALVRSLSVDLLTVVFTRMGSSAAIDVLDAQRARPLHQASSSRCTSGLPNRTLRPRGGHHLDVCTRTSAMLLSQPQMDLFA
jgi:hypothetical protein